MLLLLLFGAKVPIVVAPSIVTGILELVWYYIYSSPQALLSKILDFIVVVGGGGGGAAGAVVVVVVVVVCTVVPEYGINILYRIAL